MPKRPRSLMRCKPCNQFCRTQYSLWALQQLKKFCGLRDQTAGSSTLPLQDDCVLHSPAAGPLQAAGPASCHDRIEGTLPTSLLLGPFYIDRKGLSPPKYCFLPLYFFLSCSPLCIRWAEAFVAESGEHWPPNPNV